MTTLKYPDPITGEWKTIGFPSGGTPGGANTQVQFNNGGAFGGDPGFTWSKVSQTLHLGNGIVTPTITADDLNVETNVLELDTSGFSIKSSGGYNCSINTGGGLYVEDTSGNGLELRNNSTGGVMITARGSGGVYIDASGSGGMYVDVGSSSFTVYGDIYSNGKKVVTEAPNDGQTYGRKNNAWSVVGSGGGSYVPIAGGVMTGLLTLPELRVNGANGAPKNITFTTNNSPRWQFTSNANIETGGNEGSIFALSMFDDNGNALRDAFQINRIDGGMTIFNPVQFGQYSTPGTITLASDKNFGRSIYYATGSKARWQVACTSENEAGSNAGSNFVINRFADNGSYIGMALGINRANGGVQVVSLTATNSLTANGAYIYSNIEIPSNGYSYIDFRPFNNGANDFDVRIAAGGGAAGATGQGTLSITAASLTNEGAFVNNGSLTAKGSVLIENSSWPQVKFNNTNNPANNRQAVVFVNNSPTGELYLQVMDDSNTDQCQLVLRRDNNVVTGGSFIANSYNWNANTGLNGLVSNGYGSAPPYQYANIFNATSSGDACQATMYLQPGVTSFIQYGVGGAGNYYRMNNTGQGTSQGGWVATSDRRVKENLRPIKNALAMIERWTGYTFDKLDCLDMQGKPIRKAGLIAQEVQLDLPEAVGEDAEDERFHLKPLTLDHMGPIAVLVNAVKELAARVAALENA